MDIPEIDNSAVYIDMSTSHIRPVMVMFEVKNRRPYYYANDEEVVALLKKAAIVQDARRTPAATS